MGNKAQDSVFSPFVYFEANPSRLRLRLGCPVSFGGSRIFVCFVYFVVSRPA
jgi:hypothetical protein